MTSGYLIGDLATRLGGLYARSGGPVGAHGRLLFSFGNCCVYSDDWWPQVHRVGSGSSLGCSACSARPYLRTGGRSRRRAGTGL